MFESLYRRIPLTLLEFSVEQAPCLQELFIPQKNSFVNAGVERK
jgi:hypothetical protein